MAIAADRKYYYDVEQRSPEWYQLRCGLLTASKMKGILTPNNFAHSLGEKEKDILYELAAETINNYVEPEFMTYSMQRGIEDELRAKIIYNEKVAPLTDCGFVTATFKDGLTLGYSPDALIGDDGQFETKSRLSKFHLRTMNKQQIPDEFVIQVQTGLLVTGREYCEFVSYCGGMQMTVIRTYPYERIQQRILAAAYNFHEQKMEIIKQTHANIESSDAASLVRFFPTERVIEQDITV